jgi:hypothetical protein
MNIKDETLQAIWHARREVEQGTKMLEVLKEERERRSLDKSVPCLKDSFGRIRNFQLGIPSNETTTRIYDVSPELAEVIIKAHIAQKESDLSAYLIIAKEELNAQ